MLYLQAFLAKTYGDAHSDVTTSFPGRSSQWKNKQVLNGFAS